jgi:hypothetical protein
MGEKAMSTVLEPRNSVLMGRERYKDSSRGVVESTAYVSDNGSRLQWERCFAKLREIRSYDVDWNDEGGIPPTLQVVSQALSIAKTLRINREPAPSRCHATDEGNIIMSWDDANEYFELEIDENLCCTGRWLRPGALRAESAIIEAFSQPS